MKQIHRDLRSPLEIRRLAYQATRNEAARYVLHDALLESVPAYANMIAYAERVARSFERRHISELGKQLVVFNRKKFAENWRRPWESLGEEELYLSLAGPLNVQWKKSPAQGTSQSYILDRINQFFIVRPSSMFGGPPSERWDPRDTLITYVTRRGRWKELEEPTAPSLERGAGRAKRRRTL